MYGLYHFSTNSCVTCTLGSGCQCYFYPVSGTWMGSNTNHVTFTSVSVRVTILQCLVSGKTATPAVWVATLLFSSVWYLERQQHQLCECQSYYSPVSGIWKDSNTSCVSVKLTIIQCLVSGKTATPAVLVSRLLFSSVWYLERQQHQLCECQGYYSPAFGIWKNINASCVTFISVSDCHGYFSPVSGTWKDSNTSCVTSATPAVSLS